MNSNTGLYERAGVNVPLSDAFSKHLGKLCRSTYENSPLAQVVDLSRGHFRGPRGFSPCNLPEGYIIVCAPDGIGTKVILNTAAAMQETSGFDLVAMTAGDITRHGGAPMVVTNVLDTAYLGKDEDDPAYLAHLRLAQGLVTAAGKSKLVLLNGETAVLGVCVGSQINDALTKYNWASVAIGVNHPDKVILGDEMRPGDAIIALKENGFRSNGISLVRRILGQKFGNEWWNNPEAGPSIRAAAAPAVLYDDLLVYLNGWTSPDFKPVVKLTGIAHLSGGGIESKFAEDLVFANGLSAHLESLPNPPDIMKLCAEWGEVSDEECYATWHGGPGTLVVCKERDLVKVVRVAGEKGIHAQRCGIILEPDADGPSVTIDSRFTPGKKVVYRPKAKAA
jgi:phosphoribosylformylglycinamidine cyclo-ligase